MHDCNTYYYKENYVQIMYRNNTIISSNDRMYISSRACSILNSPKHGSVTSVSLTLPVPALQVHILGVPPAEVLLVGQAAHTPEEG